MTKEQVLKMVREAEAYRKRIAELEKELAEAKEQLAMIAEQYCECPESELTRDAMVEKIRALQSELKRKDAEIRRLRDALEDIANDRNDPILRASGALAQSEVRGGEEGGEG